MIPPAVPARPAGGGAVCPLDDRDNPRRPLTPRERRLLLVALALVGVMVALARYGLPLP